MVGTGAGALRLLLLALLSIGVIGMHTVGHSTDHHSWSALPPDEATHATAADVVGGGAPQRTAIADPCSGDCGAPGPLTIWPDLGWGSDRMPGGAGLMIVCLAVLSGLGLVALLAHALARRPGKVPRAGPPDVTRLRSAGPAFVPWLPLRLVDVAVLRI